jgi:subtilisin
MPVATPRLMASLGLAALLVALTIPLPAFAADEAAPMIVVLKRTADVDDAVERGRGRGARPTHTFRHAARGYAAELTRSQIREIERDPAVLAVVPDAVVELTAQSIPPGIRRVRATKSPIAKIDGLDGAGQRVDVDVAIIDTGIQPDHPDLNVVGGYDCSRPGTSAERSKPSRWKDENGHGTHVAGIVGALDNSRGVVGVAPGARLWSVRVFEPDGYSRISWIACGIDWITSKRDPADPSRPLIEVANMSLRDKGSDDGNCGYTNADIEHQAICRSVAKGTTYVVAAGNDRTSAARWRPGAYDEVITVSAIADFDGKAGGLAAATCTSFGKRDVDDTFADFSNYGADVDITAPGVCVRSTIPGSGYGTISGTSMATPTVAGGAALYIAAHPGASPSEVRAALRAAGSFDWRTSTDRDSTHEPLLDVSSFGAGAGLALSLSPTSATAWAGRTTARSTIRLTRLDGHTGEATFGVNGLPEGVTASFSRASFTGRSVGTTTITLAVDAAVPPGDYPLALTATAGEIVGTKTFTLVVKADFDAPVVAITRESIVAPSTLTSDGVSVRTRWTATDDVSGVARSVLGERRDGGSWAVVATTEPTTRSHARRTPIDVLVQHRIRATDVAGNTSGNAEGTPFTVKTYSEGTANATWSSGWSTVSNTKARGGKLRYATKAGSRVTFTFTGSSVAWLSRLSSTSGKARVSIDGTYVKTVDLVGATTYKRVVFAADVAHGKHTLTIEVLGTSGRPRVDVDGFIILR